MAKTQIVRIGIIGLGARAETLLASLFLLQDEVAVTAVCDLSEVRRDKIAGIFDKNGVRRPALYADYHELIASDDVDAVLVPTSWNSHLRIACEAMKAGKYAGIEVGGAASVDELWQLVHASEATGVSCMMLENCCYGRNELLALNLARKGLFGELIYCECGYEHDLSEMALQLDIHHERAMHNLRRNGELYPTHGLGPIAKILRINRGNRMVSLTSTATKARGFAHAAKKAGRDLVFNEGDIINTIIKCANGETIMMTHGVSLPRPYSRDCRVQGTNGIWLENTNGIYIEGRSRTIEEIDVAGNPYTTHCWDKVDDYYAEFDHPIWREFAKNPAGGHGGMDILSLRAFFDAVRRRAVPPIDVYDCAAWMCVTCLSEDSIATGSSPVAVPDFTNGKWIDRSPLEPSRWALDEVYDL